MVVNKRLSHTSNFAYNRISPIKYIVVHYTGNKGDTAENNASYFANTPKRKASAHYFVDKKSIWQSVEDKDTAWHCGADTTYRHKICRNYNSIGVEICDFFTKNDGALELAVELIKELMEKYNIPIENVIRHYDVTGKNCPLFFVQNAEEWGTFKNSLLSKNKGDDEEVAKMVYNYIDQNMPSWARPTIQKLVDKGVLTGNENGELGLTDEMLKLFVVHDRLGIYDR